MPERNTGTDALTLLKEDHTKVRGLLAKLEKTTERASEGRAKLLEQIQQELRIHTTIEEEIFYPAYKEAVSRQEDKKLYQEALEEHHVVDFVLGEIAGSAEDSEEFSAKAKVLKELVEHHAEEEEGQMFPRAKRAMDAGERKELGQKMEERKRELESSDRGWLKEAGKLIAAVTGRSNSSGSGRRGQSEGRGKTSAGGRGKSATAARKQSSAAARGSGTGSKKATGGTKKSSSAAGQSRSRAKAGGSGRRKQAK